MSRDREYVEIAQLRGFLRPERLERIRRVCPALSEKVAEAQQMPGLQSVGLIADHGLEKRYSFEKLTLTVISQANIQPDSGDLRH